MKLLPKEIKRIDYQTAHIFTGRRGSRGKFQCQIVVYGERIGFHNPRAIMKTRWHKSYKQARNEAYTLCEKHNYIVGHVW